MARAPLSFDQAALIGLEAVPHRLLREQASDDQIITELLHLASQFPKRTKRQLEQHGRGTPTVRRDLIAIAVGRQLRQHRLSVRRHGQPDHERHDDVARLLRQAGEAAGGLDEALIRLHEWPDVPPRPLNMNPQQVRDWELEWLVDEPPIGPPAMLASVTADDRQGVWCRLDLTTVAVVEPYSAGKTAWARKVNWTAVCAVALDLLDHSVFDDPMAATAAGRQLRRGDAMALSLLRSDPIAASPEQITNGVHRIAAMRAQGVRWTVQYC